MMGDRAMYMTSMYSVGAVCAARLEYALERLSVQMTAVLPIHPIKDIRSPSSPEVRSA